MQYLGDYAEDYADLNFGFPTHKTDGTPITLAGTPVVSVYKSNSTTQSTAGVTLSVDFDGMTGSHNVKIDLSADAFYAVGTDYKVIITTGTVDAKSVVGTVLAHFSIENRCQKANLVSILGTALTETAGQIAAAFKKFFNVAAPTGTVNSIPDAVAGANGGLPTTNGTKINQTVDLTAGQSIACSDKTGFSLTSDYPLKTDLADTEDIQSGLATATNVSDAQEAIIDAIGDSAIVLPVMQGRVYTATAIQGREVVIVQGATPRITFDLDEDYTGWTPYFGAKASLADTVYVVNPKAGTWIDDDTGAGYVDLTAAETETAGKFLAEIELRNGDQRLTAMKFTLKIIGEIIKG